MFGYGDRKDRECDLADKATTGQSREDIYERVRREALEREQAEKAARQKKVRRIWTLVGVALAVLFVGMLFEKMYLNILLLWFISSGWILLLFLGVSALLWRQAIKTDRFGRFIAIGVTFWVVGGALVLWGGAYLQALTYSANVQVSDASSVPAFKQRAAFVVAEAQAQNAVTVPGNRGETTYIPQQDRFTTPVASRDAFGGYLELTNQKLNTTGQAQSASCTFDTAASARFGGWLGSNLYRKVIQTVGFGKFASDSDAYAYCDDSNTPIVVVPLKQMTGFWPLTEQPAGVALYNGKTGEVTVRQQVEADEIPGPVFPVSITERVWRSTSAMEGFWPWFWNQAGFISTSDAAAKDADARKAAGKATVADPNAENPTDFALTRVSDGGVSYVTPLVNTGQSGSIVALGVSEGDAVTAGRIPTYQVYRYSEPRMANTSMVDRIKGDYTDLNWANGMTIFEITPAASDQWVASLGLRQSVSYRLQIEADGDSCLLTTDDKVVRCTGSLATSNQDETKGKTILSSDLTVLTDEQLVELNQKVAAEFTRRQAQR